MAEKHQSNNAASPVLDIIDRQGVQGPSYELARDVIIVGRSSKANLQLDNQVLSRQHAQLRRDALDQWWIKDLGSRNGTRVNGVALTREIQLGHDDKITIGPYTLRFRSKPATTTSLRAETATHATITDTPTGKLETFDRHAGTRIDTRHLASIDTFGSRLLQTDDKLERMTQVCELIVGDLFHGRSAMVLQIDVENMNDPPQVLVGPITAANRNEATAPYVSRTLLRAVIDKGLPTLASASGGEGRIEMSNVSDGGPRGGVETATAACPLLREDNQMELLYVTLPNSYGNAQWLALMSLAVGQYQQAEAQAVMRRNAAQRLAIDNDLKRARSIQSGLVPRHLAFPKLDVAVGFEPCRWVGGDYADAMTMPDGRAMLFLADVSGKGLPAALVTASLHAMVHALIRAGASPEQMMTNLNDHLCEFLPEGSFVTAIALCFDPDRDGHVTCVNAGHMQPIIVNAQGESRLIAGCDITPLGIMQQPIEAVEDRIDIDDAVVLYSDGLSEMRNNADMNMLGTDGVETMIVELIRKAETADLVNLQQAITERLSNIQGDLPSEDDQTFLLARRNA